MKVCGITQVEDALYAESCGAWAIGVILFSDSPRSVSVELADEIFSALSLSTISVAVTHTTSDQDLRAILDLHPRAVQIYHPFPMPAGHRGKVFRVLQRGVPPLLDADAMVLDDSHGTGKGYDLTLAKNVMKETSLPIILAGGLNPNNVRDAIALLHPCAVDVSSGVERSPGIKDKEKVQAFFTACKEAAS